MLSGRSVTKQSGPSGRRERTTFLLFTVQNATLQPMAWSWLTSYGFWNAVWYSQLT